MHDLLETDSDDNDNDSESDSDNENPVDRLPAIGHNLDSGWNKKYVGVNKQFLRAETETGPKNIPVDFDGDTKAIEYIELFLGVQFGNDLCDMTNLRATQTKELKPNDYYANKYSLVSPEEMMAFIGLRLQMEYAVIKPRYEQYWTTSGKNFISCTPGFRDVMDRDRDS
ncbi:hypothetical protein GQR58_021667 [Nymphon striatum]|nr:hypothetical protein GQR58_021667 [Nymphon striatum]